MSDRLIEILLRLAPRERFLLGVLGLVVVPLTVWLWVLVPLQEARVAAQQDLRDARALAVWVDGRVAEQAALAGPDAAGPVPPIGISGLEQSLVSAGLRDRVSDLANAAGGGVELGFDAVPFVDLILWLSGADPGWGYEIADFRLERTEDPGLVVAKLQLEPQS